MYYFPLVLVIYKKRLREINTFASCRIVFYVISFGCGVVVILVYGRDPIDLQTNQNVCTTIFPTHNNNVKTWGEEKKTVNIMGHCWYILEI